MHDGTPEPEIFNLEYNEGEEDVEDDMMILFNSIKDSIWDTSPLQNPRLKAKMHQVAHSNTVEVLTLSALPVDPYSEGY